MANAAHTVIGDRVPSGVIAMTLLNDDFQPIASASWTNITRPPHFEFTVLDSEPAPTPRFVSQTPLPRREPIPASPVVGRIGRAVLRVLHSRSAQTVRRDPVGESARAPRPSGLTARDSGFIDLAATEYVPQPTLQPRPHLRRTPRNGLRAHMRGPSEQPAKLDPRVAAARSSMSAPLRPSNPSYSMASRSYVPGLSGGPR